MSDLIMSNADLIMSFPHLKTIHVQSPDESASLYMSSEKCLPIFIKNLKKSTCLVT